MDSLVGLIIAKGESKRLPGKNRLEFRGKPMFLHNVERCLKVFDRVYVSSDNWGILDAALKVGAIPIKRDGRLGGEVPDIRVYQHAIKKMGRVSGVVAVHANNPTIKMELIILTASILASGASEVMTCYPITRTKKYKDQYAKIYGSIRGLTTERIKNYGDPYKPNPDVWITDDSVEIETIKDYKKCLKT